MCRLFSAAHGGHARYRRDLTPRSSHQEEGITKKARPAYLRTGPTVSEGERQGSGHAPARVLPLPLPAAFTAADTAKAGTCRRAGSGPLCRRCLHHRGQRTKPCEKAKSKAAGKTPQGGDSQGEALGGTEPFLRDQACHQKGTSATSTGHCCSSSAFLAPSQTALSGYTASQSQLPQQLPA